MIKDEPVRLQAVEQVIVIWVLEGTGTEESVYRNVGHVYHIGSGVRRLGVLDPMVQREDVVWEGEGHIEHDGDETYLKMDSQYGSIRLGYDHVADDGTPLKVLLLKERG